MAGLDMVCVGIFIGDDVSNHHFSTPHSEEISLSQGDMVVLPLAQKSRETTKIQTTSKPSG
jgi:hypothetical protein